MEILKIGKLVLGKPNDIDPCIAMKAEIKQIERKIKTNENIFNMATEPSLIDAIIYENMALRIRYSRLMQELRYNISLGEQSKSAALREQSPSFQPAIPADSISMVKELV